MLNRLHNCHNRFQGGFKRVLTVCSAGLLRSPTAAWVLSQEPYNYNTRACGAHDYALVPVDGVLLAWADEIVCMEKGHLDIAQAIFSKNSNIIMEERRHNNRGILPWIVLDIPDTFSYRDPELVERIKTAYNKDKELRNV